MTGIARVWGVRGGLAFLAAGMVLAVVPAGPGAAVAAVRPAAAGWGTAEEIPGTATLNQGNANVDHALSCASAGNCTVGAFYTDANGHYQAFADTETAGTWGTAQELPGVATLNKGNAEMYTVSCGSAGNCSAGGYYTDANRHEQAFVARETGGTWAAGKEVPGTAKLNVDGDAELASVSCPAANACSGGGGYIDSSDAEQGYVDSETSGTWGTAKEVPGLAALNTGGGAEVQFVSCVSAGNCTAGGSYSTSSGDEEPFVVTETGGTWGNAEEVPGIGTLNDQQGPMAGLSCASAGNCTAVGTYTDSAGDSQAWLASEVNGTWRAAKEVPGTATLNTDGFAEADAVSCASAGNCTAGGWYTGTSIQAFVITETAGVWGTAKAVPGLAALNTNGYAQLWTVSCAAAGDCSAGGFYWNDSEGGQEAFVVTQTNGTWGDAKEVPGTETLNVNGGGVTADISCSTAAHCAAAGLYGDSSAHLQAFVDTQT